MKPIEFFKDDKELNERLEYWKPILGLSDWFIVARLAPKEDFSNEDWAGECRSDQVAKSASILLRKDAREISDDLYARQYQEQVLLHEMMHCKIMLVAGKAYEDTVCEAYYHSIIDDMSKAIFFAKYNMSLKDFEKKEKKK